MVISPKKSDLSKNPIRRKSDSSKIRFFEIYDWSKIRLFGKYDSSKNSIRRKNRFVEFEKAPKWLICRHFRSAKTIDSLELSKSGIFWPENDEIFRRDSETDDLHPPKRSRDDIKLKKNQNRQPSKGRTKEPNLRNELEAPNVPVLKDWKKMEEDEHPQESFVDSPKLRILRKTRHFEILDSSKLRFFEKNSILRNTRFFEVSMNRKFNCLFGPIKTVKSFIIVICPIVIMFLKFDYLRILTRNIIANPKPTIYQLLWPIKMVRRVVSISRSVTMTIIQIKIKLLFSWLRNDSHLRISFIRQSAIRSFKTST